MAAHTEVGVSASGLRSDDGTLLDPDGRPMRRVFVKPGRSGNAVIGPTLTTPVFDNQPIEEREITPEPGVYLYYVLRFGSAIPQLVVAAPAPFVKWKDYRYLTLAIKQYFPNFPMQPSCVVLFPDSTGRIHLVNPPDDHEDDTRGTPSLLFDEDASADWLPGLPAAYAAAPRNFYGDGVPLIGGYFPDYRLIAAREVSEDICSALFHWHGMFFLYDGPTERILPLGTDQYDAIETLWDFEQEFLDDDTVEWLDVVDLERFGAWHFFEKDSPVMSPDLRFKAELDPEAAAEWYPHLPESFHIDPSAFNGDDPSYVKIFFKGYKLIAARGPSQCIGALFHWRNAFWYWDSVERRALPLGTDRPRAREILHDLEHGRQITKETNWMSWGDLDHCSAARLFKKTAEGYKMKWPTRIY
jgi:hypothetical protein